MSVGRTSVRRKVIGFDRRYGMECVGAATHSLQQMKKRGFKDFPWNERGKN